MIQYINLIKSDLESQEYGEAISTDEGGRFPFVPADSFEQDDTLGHGTHVACTVAGATLQVKNGLGNTLYVIWSTLVSPAKRTRYSTRYFYRLYAGRSQKKIPRGCTGFQNVLVIL